MIDFKQTNKHCLKVSVLLNIVLVIFVLALIINKYSVHFSFADYSYLSNLHYETDLSMFKLVDRDVEIIFAGDSITAYGRFDEFFPEKSVFNRGIGTDVTEGLYNRIDEVISHHPHKIFIMIGINDMQKKIPIDKSMKYYEMIISEIQHKLPECIIYVQSVLPTKKVDLVKIEDFNNRLRDLSARRGVVYIDLYSRFLIDGEPNDEFLSSDKIHLNGSGYKIWIDSVKGYM